MEDVFALANVFAEGERNRNSLSRQYGKAKKKKYVRFSFRLYIGAAEKVVTGSFSIVYQSFLEIKCTGFLEKHVKVVHLKILSFQN
jgi:hypothetical protein